MIGRVCLALGFVLASLTATGCAEEPGSVADPTGATSLDYENVQLVAPDIRPTFPDEARQETEAGAIAFVRFWFDGLNYSLANNDDTLLASSTGGGCPQCNSWFVIIARNKSDGATMQGGVTAPLSLAIGPVVPGEPVLFVADFVSTEAVITQPDGSSQSYPRLVSKGSVTILWSQTAGQWLMSSVDLQVENR